AVAHDLQRDLLLLAQLVHHVGEEHLRHPAHAQPRTHLVLAVPARGDLDGLGGGLQRERGYFAGSFFALDALYSSAIASGFASAVAFSSKDSRIDLFPSPGYSSYEPLRWTISAYLLPPSS